MACRLYRRWGLSAVCLVAGSVILGGCDIPRFGQPAPASEEAQHALRLWQEFFLAACAVGAVVVTLIVVAAIRFRRRSNRIPNQKPYNIAWEIVYTVTPVVMVIVLFFASVSTQHQTEHRVTQPYLQVDVVGFQWGWQFRYPGRDIVITGSAESGRKPVLVLPAGRTSRLTLTTTDVIHSFWVPAFLAKRDMIPGIDNSIDVTPNTIGSFDGKCAEYCSLDHWRMSFTLKVVPADQFATALAYAVANNGAP